MTRAAFAPAAEAAPNRAAEAAPDRAAEAAPERVRLLAAGSLRAALTDLARDFAAAEGAAVSAEFAASGALCARIAGGERADLFASADLGHPRRLAALGLAGPVRTFARTRLVTLAAPHVGADSETLLDAMLDPALRLGTSTPGADPCGDYAEACFDRAEALRPGASAALRARALRLTGAPDSPRAPPDCNLYGWTLASGRADLFLTYAANAAAALADAPGLRVIPLPPGLAVTADYGLTVLRGASPAAARLADLVLSPQGRATLARCGFDPPED